MPAVTGEVMLLSVLQSQETEALRNTCKNRVALVCLWSPTLLQGQRGFQTTRKLPSYTTDNGLHFPTPFLQPTISPHYSLRSFHPNNFLNPTTRISAFQNSFLPSSVYLWNSLLLAPKKTQSLSFKYLNLLCYVTNALSNIYFSHVIKLTKQPHVLNRSQLTASTTQRPGIKTVMILTWYSLWPCYYSHHGCLQSISTIPVATTEIGNGYNIDA